MSFPEGLGFANLFLLLATCLDNKKNLHLEEYLYLNRTLSLNCWSSIGGTISVVTCVNFLHARTQSSSKYHNHCVKIDRL